MLSQDEPNWLVRNYISYIKNNIPVWECMFSTIISTICNPCTWLICKLTIVSDCTLAYKTIWFFFLTGVIEEYGPSVLGGIAAAAALSAAAYYISRPPSVPPQVDLDNQSYSYNEVSYCNLAFFKLVFSM